MSLIRCYLAYQITTSFGQQLLTLFLAIPWNPFWGLLIRHGTIHTTYWHSTSHLGLENSLHIGTAAFRGDISAFNNKAGATWVANGYIHSLWTKDKLPLTENLCVLSSPLDSSVFLNPKLTSWYGHSHMKKLSL